MFLFLQVAIDRVQIVIEFSCVAVAHLTRLFNNFVVPHNPITDNSSGVQITEGSYLALRQIRFTARRRVMLALLTRQRDMLKIERIFNTFREHVADFNMSATSLFRHFLVLGFAVSCLILCILAVEPYINRDR